MKYFHKAYNSKNAQGGRHLYPILLLDLNGLIERSEQIIKMLLGKLFWHHEQKRVQLQRSIALSVKRIE
jgi:hypothetical protein